jgi:hypothetical protein
MLPSLGAIALIIEEELATMPYRTSVMMSLLRKNDQFQKEIKWDANAGGAQVSGRAATSDPTTQATDNVIAASLPIGNYVIDHTFSIQDTDLVQLANLPPQNAPAALRNLFQAHVQTAFDVIFPKLNQLLFTGTGASNTTQLQVSGLAAVINNAVAYAGIDPATYPLWVAYVNDNAGTDRALSRELFSAVDVAIFNSGSRYDVCFTTANIAELYKALFNKIVDVQINSPAMNVDIGSTGLAYNGAPILRDKDCPAEHFYLLDSSKIELRTFAQGSTLDTAAYPQMAQVVQSQKIQGLNLLVSQLPRTNPQAIKYNISLMAQLKVHDRKAVSVIKDISENLAYISGDASNTLVLPSPSPSP